MWLTTLSRRRFLRSRRQSHVVGGTRGRLCSLGGAAASAQAAGFVTHTAPALVLFAIGCPAKIDAVKVASPLGDYPFLFRRLERRDGGLAIVGTVAGLESSLLLDREDLRKATRVLAAALAATLLAAAWRRRQRRSRQCP